MKKMITAVAALLMSAATFAQTSTTTAAPKPATAPVQRAERKQPDPAAMGKRETDRINGITPLGTAYDKVLAVNTDFATKRQALKSTVQGEPTQEQATELRAKGKEMQDAHKKSLEEAMGKDLYTKYEAAVKAEREERRAQRAKQNQPIQAPAPAAK